MKNNVLSALGISQLSEMQLSVSKIWKEQEDNDIVLLSPTGSGKTIAYLLPLMERIDTGKDSVQAVVIVPSRELAMQTDEVVKNMKAQIFIFDRPAGMDISCRMTGMKRPTRVDTLPWSLK